MNWWFYVLLTMSFGIIGGYLGMIWFLSHREEP